MSTSRSTRVAVTGIFFLSGISGLVYQVIWVRQLARIFGNTVQSASLVAGVFMAGLGVGAYVLGRWGDAALADDPVRPLRLYARAELGIAAIGVALALVLPRLGALSVAVSTYVVDGRGWHHLSALSYAFRYLVAIALVAPPTFLMGGTLTLIIRFVVAKDVGAAASRIGLLYAANTAGAALGALLTDLLLVPTLGVFGAQLVAAALNAAAGLLGLALARSPRLAVDAPPPVPTEASPDDGDGSVAATAVALGLSGFASMGLEILWFRFLSSALGQYRAVFSLLLAVILAGIGLGALCGAWIHRRYGRPALLSMGTLGLLTVTTLGLIGLVDPRPAMGLAFLATSPLPGWAHSLALLSGSVRPIAVIVLVPAVLMGMSFPLANANVQRAAASVGGRAGLLYLANTAGNVLGCALAGFVLLPALGAQRTTLLLATSAAASILPFYLSARQASGAAALREATAVLAASLGCATIAIAAFAALPSDWLLSRTLPRDNLRSARRILALREGVSETLAVTEVPGFFRELLTNGHAMSSTHPKSQRYMRAFAHVPLLSIDDPKTALVICFGVGNTTDAVSLHPSIERVDVADLSQGVLEQAHSFAASNHDVLGDPRVSVFVNDGRHHLLMQPEGSYDLVTLEPPPIAFAGVASLYSRDFYALARSRLTARGFVTQWLPAYQVPEEAVRAAVRAFVEVFPESVLLSGDDNELILMGTKGPSIRMDPSAMAARIRRSPAVLADLERVNLGDMTEIAGMFAASNATMTRATRAVTPVTDDRPSLEYSLLSSAEARRMPADLFDVTGIDAWCAGCVDSLPRLAAYLRLRGAIYASDWFLATPSETPLNLASVPDAADTIAASPYLQVLVGGPALQAKAAARESWCAGRVDDAVTLFEVALSYDPSDAEARADLGRLLARPRGATESVRIPCVASRPPPR